MSLFITFEGVEGSGKSSHILSVQKDLKQRNIQYIITREPGGTRIGDAIRDVLLMPDHTEMSPETELLLYLASRKQNLEELIRPALHSGKVVLCDRYEDSSIVYQGLARGIGMDRVIQLSRMAGIDLKPHLTILFDVDAETGLERARGRPLDGITRFENEHLTFHKKVREGYLLLSEKEPDRFVIVDTSKPFDVVRAAVIEIILKALGIQQ